MFSRRHKTGNVCHIHHEVSAHFVGYFPETLEVDGSGISACSRENEFGLALLCDTLDLVVIYHAGFLVHTVRHDIEIFTGNIHGRAVAEVSAVRQIHAQHGIAGLNEREEYGKVRACSAVRLHVCEVCAEQLFSPFDRQIFRHIHEFASAVISLTGITFRILVGEEGTHCRHNRGRYYIFARNQFQIAALTGKFQLERFVKFRVEVLDNFEIYHNLYLLCLFFIVFVAYPD